MRDTAADEADRLIATMSGSTRVIADGRRADPSSDRVLSVERTRASASGDGPGAESMSTDGCLDRGGVSLPRIDAGRDA